MKLRRLSALAAASLVWISPVGAAPAISPGGVEVAAIKGEVTASRVRGFADVELRVPMRRTGIFRLASMTKQFTAVAILSLIQDGKLSLGDRTR